MRGVFDAAIPGTTDWVDQGTVVGPTSGGWDARLLGGFSPCSLTKQSGTYFLYYIGASGGRSNDNGPAFRALGVLTSTDGVNWTKYSGNPVITHWEPEGHSNQQEAGIFTTTSLLDDDGTVVLFAGAMTASGPDSVVDDGKLYTSPDGLNFTLITTVLDHTDPLVWGSGDEIDPLTVFKHPLDGTWHMYYSAANFGWALAYQSGVSRDMFDPSTSQPVIQGGALVVGCSSVLISPDQVALFVNRVDSNWTHWFTEVYTVSVDDPTLLNGPVVTYDFSNSMGGAVFLDRDTNQWFWFYNNGTEQFPNNPGAGVTIGLRTAPATFI